MDLTLNLLHRMGALALLVLPVGCHQVYSYPDPTAEGTAAVCSDGKDNDYDGEADCADTDCDGFCTEESLEACRDERDNDQDGLVDTEDPRCWLLFPPTTKRCAAEGGAEIVDGLDNPDRFLYSTWIQEGRTPDLYYVVNSAYRGFLGSPDSSRLDPAVVFSHNTTGDSALDTNLGAFWRHLPFAGSWRDLELSFTASVPPGALLRAAIVPINQARWSEAPVRGVDAAVLSVTVDASQSPPVLTMDVEGTREQRPLPFTRGPCEGGAYCDEYPLTVSLRLEHNGFRARVVYPDERAEELQGRPPTSDALQAARLVFWGGTTTRSGYAMLDDVRLRIAPRWPCGHSVPEIAGASACELAAGRGSFGHGVSVARSNAGQYCALVTASTDAAAGPELVTAWELTEAATFGPAGTPGEATIPLPDGAELVGAAIAADARGWHAVVAYRDESSVRVAFADGASCAEWSDLELGPELFADSEAPSYVIAAGQHEIYFTRPPRGDRGRTLWGFLRGAPDAQPLLLGELPPDVGAPVAIQLAGARDRVLTHPVVGAETDVGLLVLEPSLTAWQAVPTPVLKVPFQLGTVDGYLAFDDRGIASAALAFGPQGGFVLYGGRTATPAVVAVQDADQSVTPDPEVLSVGTAWFAPDGRLLPDAPVIPEKACGDGQCSADEDCSSCDRDCACGGVELVRDATAHGSAWQRISSEPRAGQQAYFLTDPPSLGFTGGAATWALLPLDEPINGDFELSFDLFQPFCRTNQVCALYAGVGTVPDPSALAAGPSDEGIFARIEAPERCRFARETQPFVLSAGVPQALEASAATECQEFGDEWRHVVLTRQGNRVTVTAPGPDGCGDIRRTLTYAGSVSSLSNVLFGFGGGSFHPCLLGGDSGNIRNVKVRLLDDPSDCPTTKQLCSPPTGPPSCVDTSSSNEHCGSCGHACLAHEICRQGECSCGDAPGALRCADACVDSRSSPAHCGACDRACASHCAHGVCDAPRGDCESPLAVPGEGGTVTVDFSTLGSEFGPLCGGLAAKRVILSFTPTRSGRARLSVSRLTLIGLTEDTSCSDWPRCNWNANGYVTDSTIVPVTEGIDYRIGLESSDNVVDFTIEYE